MAAIGTHPPYTDEDLRNLAHEFVSGGYPSYAEFSRVKGYYVSNATNWFGKLGYQHPELRQYIREFQQEKLKQLANTAIEVESDLMRNAKSEQVRLSAAKDVLSRAGFDPVSKAEIAATNEIEINIVKNDQA